MVPLVFPTKPCCRQRKAGGGGKAGPAGCPLPWAALKHFSDREPLWKLPAWKHRTAPRKERLSCPKKPPSGRFGDRASAPPPGRPMSAELQEQNRGAGPGTGGASGTQPLQPPSRHSGAPFTGVVDPHSRAGIPRLCLPLSSERSRRSAHACGLRPREGIGPAATKQTAGTGTQGSHAGEPTNAAGHSALCRACGSVPSRPRAAPRDEWALTTEHFWSKTEQSPPLHAPVAKITPASACGVAENIRGAFRPARTLLPLVPPAPTPPGLLSALCKHLHVGRGGLFDPYARGLRTHARAHARTHRLLAQKRGDARSTPPPLARPYRFPAAVCTRYPFLCTAVTCVCV